MVDHNTLIYKLEHYGIRGHALNWLKSYLNKRRQYSPVHFCIDVEQIYNNAISSLIGPVWSLGIIKKNPLKKSWGKTLF